MTKPHLRWSIIIPAKNEQDNLPALLSQLAAVRDRGAQIILVDGGSSDNTIEVARQYIDQLLQSEPGRAKQLQLGVEHSQTEYLLFLHADSVLPDNFCQCLESIQSTSKQLLWGRFDVRLNSEQKILALVGWMINWRSRLSGIATGDQGIFIHKDLLQQIGGIPQLPLMEDVELSKRLKMLQPPLCLRDQIVTSARKWHNEGAWRTIFLMWYMRFAYFVGVSPTRLVQRYYR